jgi:hypothetical protein
MTDSGRFIILWIIEKLFDVPNITDILLEMVGLFSTVRTFYRLYQQETPKPSILQAVKTSTADVAGIHPVLFSQVVGIVELFLTVQYKNIEIYYRLYENYS